MKLESTLHTKPGMGYIAPLLDDFTESGTTVKIVDSWQPAGSMVAMR